jgi:hypothetical protein
MKLTRATRTPKPWPLQLFSSSASRTTYVFAFAVGTTSHLVDILRSGLLPHNRYHWGLNLFWTSLAFFDPLAIVLLLRRARAGILLACLIMFLDVAVNLAAGVHEYFATGRFLMWGLYTQVPFALFILATASSLWSAFGADSSSARQGWKGGSV